MVLMTKKTVVSVDIVCLKCRQKVMMLIASIEGITSIVLDPSKNTATIIGEADPVAIIKKVRKVRRCAQITSIGPAKEEKKDEKKNEKKEDKKDAAAPAAAPPCPKTCHRCDVWYVVGQDYVSPCPIL